MQRWNFSIITPVFRDLLLKKHFLLSLELKTVVLLNILEKYIYLFFIFYFFINIYIYIYLLTPIRIFAFVHSSVYISYIAQPYSELSYCRV